MVYNNKCLVSIHNTRRLQVSYGSNSGSSSAPCAFVTVPRQALIWNTPTLRQWNEPKALLQA